MLIRAKGLLRYQDSKLSNLRTETYFFMTQNTPPQINIGLAVREKMSEQGTTITWLAKQVSCDSSNIRKQLYKKHIYPELLLSISIALKTDFFMYYSDWYAENSR